MGGAGLATVYYLADSSHNNGGTTDIRSPSVVRRQHSGYHTSFVTISDQFSCGGGRGLGPEDFTRAIYLASFSFGA